MHEKKSVFYRSHIKYKYKYFIKYYKRIEINKIFKTSKQWRKMNKAKSSLKLIILINN